MGLNHKVTINVTKPNGERNRVVQGERKTIRSRVLDVLLGKKMNLLVITPGDSVETVEIKEIQKGGGRP